MSLNKKQWLGQWENFENYIYSTDSDMMQTWHEAEQMCKEIPALQKMFANGCKTFWQTACNSITPTNPVRLGGWDVTETENGIAIQWFDHEGNDLGKADYVLQGTLAKGLEGKENLKLCAVNPAENWPFTCILAMEPMPERDAKNHGDYISHFHFQFSSSWDELIKEEKLTNPWWYATLCDAETTSVQKINVVRGLHKMPLIR
ncbi:hypothetical protein [Anaerosporobacter sp.]